MQLFKAIAVHPNFPKKDSWSQKVDRQEAHKQEAYRPRDIQSANI